VVKIFSFHSHCNNRVAISEKKRLLKEKKKKKKEKNPTKLILI